MTLFLVADKLKKMKPQLKGILTALVLNLTLQTALESAITPIIPPPGTPLFCNIEEVVDYIDDLPVYPGSDLAYVIRHLPLTSEGFIEAIDQMHPALLQDLSFATDENMQAFRQILTGRNAFLRHGRCRQFPGLFGNCNLGPYQMWITPFGVFNDQARLGCLQGYRSTTPGIMLGFDSEPNEHTVVGFGLGYSYTDLHWKDHFGVADWHTGYFGAYATSLYDCFYLDASFLGSYEFYKTRRDIKFSEHEESNDFYCRPEKCCDDDEDCCAPRPRHRRHRHDRIPRRPRALCGVDRHARSHFKGYAMLAHVGFGWNFDLCGLHLIPFASIDYDFVDQDGHREHKARSLNLKVKSNHAHLLRTEFGLSATSCIPYNCGWFRPSVTCSYIKKSVLQGAKFGFRFYNYPDSRAEAFGSDKSLDLVAPGFGLEMQFSSNWIMAFNYDAELSTKHITQRATCRIGRAY